jgi:hypothetical protein
MEGFVAQSDSDSEVIGINRYQHLPLRKYAVADAQALQPALFTNAVRE